LSGSAKAKSKSDATLSLINLSKKSVTGNVTVSSPDGAIKNIVRVKMAAGGGAFIPAKTLKLPASGQIEWRPDSNALPVRAMLEQAVAQQAGSSMKLSQLARKEGATPSASTRSVKLETGTKVMVANASESPLVIEVSGGSEPVQYQIAARAVALVPAEGPKNVAIKSRTAQSSQWRSAKAESSRLSAILALQVLRPGIQIR